MHCFATITSSSSSSSSHYHHHWMTAQPLTDSLTDATYMYTQTGSRQCRFRAGAGGRGGEWWVVGVGTGSSKSRLRPHIQPYS